MDRAVNWWDRKAEEAFEKLYAEERRENEALKKENMRLNSENMKLRARIETLKRMLDKVKK